MLKIALPKGRIAEQTLEIFKSIFGEEFKFDNRKLILKQGDFEFLLVRNQDIPTYVNKGGADLGVVGLDVLKEKEFDIIKLLDLEIGKCRVSIGLPNDSQIDYTQPTIKVATKMTNIAAKYFASKSMAVDIIKLNGSIELAPLVGLSDVIVDIVETGTTMRENGLKEGDVIMQSSAYLISNKNSFYSKKSEILDIYEKIKSRVG
jgi:ATP phosphoribosyltransferase